MTSPFLVMNIVGSIEPLENPLDTRKLESSSYHALGACLSPYTAFLSASAACTTEDFDTTGVDPLNNTSNIRLNSKSNSFDVVTVSAARGLEYWFVRNLIVVRNMSEKYVTVLATPESPDVEGSLQPLTEKLKETYKTISADIQNQLDVKAEVVQIILKGIDNDIYSTVDACPNAMEM
ncbi:hypothetical protein Tco_1204163 [Tanacetum coccineum]